MGITDALKAAGYTPEKSTAGDKPILNGVYKAVLVAVEHQEDKGYGESIRADFKITETLAGNDSRSTFPEFKGYFNTSPDKINSKRNGLAKLLNGFFSVGVSIDRTTDETLLESLKSNIGSTEVYVKGYKEKPRKENSDGTWSENEEADFKQKFTFMTKSNAEKEAAKIQKANGHPL